jgi:hypothetical protein
MVLLFKIAGGFLNAATIIVKRVSVRIPKKVNVFVYVMVTEVTEVKGVGVPLPHPYQPGLIFPSSWNVGQKSGCCHSVLTLCLVHISN